MRTEIGKIKSVSFGHGGYQDAMIGVTFDLGGKSWGIGDFWGFWKTRSEHAEWTEDDQVIKLGETVLRIGGLLQDAGVSDLNDLVDTPIEASFKDSILVSWRILTEVI